ncbi:fimbrial protein [Kosakonia oryziphila]|uniref:Pilin (Type 1 fimbria component protein) n=1 Tax=Kosakonia oryziphila TaxID=1005667 RepID=A0A1C4C4E6_9ENTR|nr:fimbrial protein [Kosakonia oryziphila]SCC13942.1 Pilin (type 1 fimbria component protein) [Kosakonia oryziphila]
MSLMKKALAIALLGSHVAYVYAVGYSMDVYFTGAYTDETCVIEINNGSNNEVVQLPKISVMSLQKNGNEAGSVPFNITLRECPASRTVAVFFNSAISGADTATGNLINNSGTDMSNNVQVRLRKEDSSQVVIDDATSGQDYLISATADPLSHRFLASYYAKGDSAVTAGKVQTVAGIELVYK